MLHMCMNCTREGPNVSNSIPTAHLTRPHCANCLCLCALASRPASATRHSASARDAACSHTETAGPPLRRCVAVHMPSRRIPALGRCRALLAPIDRIPDVTPSQEGGR
eukprot:1267646-Prymnesium_polylepis.1